MAEETRPQPSRTVYVKRLRRWRFALILAVVSAAVVVAAAAGWRFARTSSAPAAGPIILISIDTLRADHLPLYGYRNVRTLAIDALAAEGVVFEHAYAHSPQTLPSHVSILSGQLPFETGVRDDVGFATRPETRLLPQMLKARGYASGAVVSSYLLRRETGLAQGFDFYDSDMPAPSEGSPAPVERPGTDTVAVAQKWIASLSSPRFFLFLHIDEPHAPHAPPERFAQYAPYDAEIAYADEIVGRFLRWLKGKGLYDRATIVVLSGHGEGLGDHGEQEHGLLLHDETLRVPLVVKLPRDVNHGHRVSLPVQQIDVVPTILDLLDMPRPAALRGRSLRALLEGRRATLAAQPFYAESFYARYRFGWSVLRALTDGGYRFISAPREQLYELSQDSSERTNVIAERAPIGQAMRAALDQMVAGDVVAAPARLPVEERDRLAVLGMVTLAPSLRPTVADRVLPDPEEHVVEFERSRQALVLARARRYQEAIAIYREIVATDPELGAVWLQLADTLDASGALPADVDAFKRAAKATAGDSVAVLGAADGLLRLGKLDEAKSLATQATKAAPATAHALLARIALARDDGADARRQAALAQQADPALPMPLFVDAILLYKAGKYEAAAPAFEQALQAAQGAAIAIEELHYDYADTLTRLERYPDAESQFREEIRLFPRRVPARVSLAMLYHAQRRDLDARSVVDDLVNAAPTPEAYAAAARLWTILGDRERAAATRAISRERFGTGAMKAPKPIGINR
jgi:arylsulfatase A-like enzyme